MDSNNLFIQRRVQVSRDAERGLVHFIGTVYIAYYFYVKDELYVSKYALCIKYSKLLSELTEKVAKPQ